MTAPAVSHRTVVRLVLVYVIRPTFYSSLSVCVGVAWCDTRGHSIGTVAGLLRRRR
jgi:hypothetical protein